MSNYPIIRIEVLKKQFQSNVWENPTNGILIDDKFNERSSRSFESKKDNFSFGAINTQNQLFETFHSGDNSTVAFTLRFSPIPLSYLNTDKFQVFVSDVLQTNSVDYSISGSTLTFGSAPATGVDNVKVRFKLLEEDDLITMWRFKNDTFGNLTQAQKNTAIVAQGAITQLTENISDAARIVNVTGEGLSNVLFNALVSIGFDSSIDLAHLAIQKVILEANALNQSRKIFGENVDEWTTLGNSTVSLDITFSTSYRNASILIDELSAPEYTGDGRYGWYVIYNPRTGTTDGTTANKLVDSTASFTDGLVGVTVYNTTDGTDAVITAVDSGTVLSISSDVFVSGEDYSIKTFDFNWSKKSEAEIATITEGVLASSIEVSTDADDIKNAIIYSVGTSPRGNPQNFLYFDPTGPGGARFDFITTTNTIISQLLDDEFQAHKDDADASWTFTTDDDGKKHRVGNLPTDYTPGAGTYVMQFLDRDDDDQLVQDGVTITVTDDGEFDKAIIKEARGQGREKVLELVEFNSEFKNKLSIEVPYAADTNEPYTLGGVYTLNIDSYRIVDRKMRLVELTYELTSTILGVKEEVGL